MPVVGISCAGLMRWSSSVPPAIQRAPATFFLIVVTVLCFLLFYPLHWMGMLELFNFVPFRRAGGYVAISRESGGA